MRREPQSDDSADVRRPERVGDHRGLRVDQDRERPAHPETAQAFVNKGLADGSPWPIVAKTIPLEEVVEAYRHLASYPRFGEVVVTG
jgi:NADPH:quinone reductase-like Zn-dependent oxidoreductase